MGQGGAVKAYRWTFANAEFDEGRWQLQVAGQAIEVERRPLEVLQYLLRHAGEVVTKEELLEAAWAGRVVVEAVLTNAIGKLRRALGDEAQEVIVTLPRVGYRLGVPVSRRAVEFVPEPSRLDVGMAVPRRPHWKLDTLLARTGGNEVWLARHAKTREARVFKFSLAGEGLAALKREVTVARLLGETLGERDDFVRVRDWDFEAAPYFIESDHGGISLDKWPEAGRLADVPLQARLDLFACAADAVAAAHGVGVLHKDIKPANLLVHGPVEHPCLRVADFGSSRIMDSGQLEALGITRLGLTQTQVVSPDTGTPLYLAPEVAAGHAPTVRSDIYALGVTLYQLVVGDFRRSLVPGWERDVADPLLRKDIADFANGDASLRPASAAEVAQRIRSLEERREKLVLEEAVRARVAEGEKRLARARARRPWVWATMGVLACGLGVTGTLLKRALDSERSASEQRDVAQALNQFVEQDILGQGNPLAAGGADVRMRDALDRASPRIDVRFPSQPEVAAPLHATLARAYYVHSDYASAIRHSEAAARLFERSYGASAPDTLMQRILLAESKARAGDTAGAMAQLEDLPARLDALGPAYRARAWARYGLALSWTRWQSGDLAGAVAPMEDAARWLLLLPEPDPELEMSVQQALIMARSMAGLPVSDLVSVQQAAIEELVSSQRDGRMPLALSARYGLLRARLLTAEARTLEPEYREMISELTDLLGPRNETTLLAKHGLAHIYMKQQKWAECRRLLTSIGGDFAALLGPSHLQTVNAANTLGACLLGEGELEEADRVLSGALASLGEAGGTKASLVRVAVQINLGHVLAERGRWDELEQLLREIQGNGGKLLKASPDAAGEVYLIQGRLLDARGERSEAVAILHKALALLQEGNSDEYWLVRLARRELDRLEASQPGAA